MSPNVVSPTEGDVFFVQISPSAMPNNSSYSFLISWKYSPTCGQCMEGSGERGQKGTPRELAAAPSLWPQVVKFCDGCDETPVGMSRAGADCHRKVLGHSAGQPQESSGKEGPHRDQHILSRNRLICLIACLGKERVGQQRQYF